MLIDAGHSEETRVVVVDGSKVEEFDFESASRKPIRGNIYLAKVTRVEPSLQAAFVEYGGNRHGFLAFNEIHPDYYQIPYEDRLALAEEEAEAVAEEEAEADAKAETAPASENTKSEAKDVSDESDAEDEDADTETATDATDNDADNEDGAAESIGDDDEDEIDDQKASRRRRQLYRKYKIQEVIKRRQVILVQAAKEERGNKGAALTTYLSLAGRYCVLMPNTPRGGGISRKISNVADRKRLKSVVSELELPKGVGLIIRTAGAKRTKVEIRRDADYLTRLWETIRELTLKSVAPTLIYEEGNLVKRAIRDLYDKEIEGVWVQGEPAYKEAKAFMRMLMPSHAKNVHHYKDSVPLFLRHQVESQLEANYSPNVSLKSGGYLVINPTEALVSVDVNSGRSTRERNIENTALKTNLEAATEVARQMRLRDLAGLIVIDFIDMDENKNNRAVEKRMKEALKRDRARLQVARISQFGLMEISRQRRRASIIEGSTTTCPTCKGVGHVRSVESSALVALRGLEEEGLKGRAKRLRLSAPTSVVLYMLNDKRDHLLSIEQKFEMRISVAADDEIILPDFNIEPLESRKPGEERVIAPLSIESVQDDASPQEDSDTQEASEESREGGGRKRRRRRRRKNNNQDEAASSVEASLETTSENATEEGSTPETASDSEETPRRRRRGRRGGRGRRRTNADTVENADANVEASPSPDAEGVKSEAESNTTGETPSEATSDDKPKRKRTPRRRKKMDETTSAKDAETSTTEAEGKTEDTAKPDEAKADAATEKPKRRARRPRKKPEESTEVSADQPAKSDETPTDVSAKEEEAAKDKPKPRTRRKKAEPKTEPKSDATPTKETTKKPEPKETVNAEETKTESKKPAKKGWWNKTGLFGD